MIEFKVYGKDKVFKVKAYCTVSNQKHLQNALSDFKKNDLKMSFNTWSKLQRKHNIRANIEELSDL